MLAANIPTAPTANTLYEGEWMGMLSSASEQVCGVAKVMCVCTWQDFDNYVRVGMISIPLNAQLGLTPVVMSFVAHAFLI